MCVLILLYMCPDTEHATGKKKTTVDVVYHHCICVRKLLYIPANCYIIVLVLLYIFFRILLYMGPHTAVCVRILLYWYRLRQEDSMRPHAAIYVSAYCYMCPHTAAMLVQATARRLYRLYVLLSKHPFAPPRPQV
jgi:hypothetical protein